jgi:hydrogenase maturation protein HypF
LVGHVGNDTEGVFIEVEGPSRDVDRFATRLIAEAPPLAKIFEVTVTASPLGDESEFRIVASDVHGHVRTFVSPDISTCDDCCAELMTPEDRRFRYPFINCTNCGPRFTITRCLPYDRPNTTMAAFAMCEACALDYHDPSNRRFHAQPIACEDCGPRLSFDDVHGAVAGTDAALAQAQRALARGEIVAVKGLGGYHLACNATSKAAVGELRRRKGRADKPLAVMVRDVEIARTLADLAPSDAALLTGLAHPIVLLHRRDEIWISELVAPGSPYLGIVLPYTPLHQLLFHQVPGSTAPVPTALVMTSGNLSDEPICYEDADARHRLRGLADAWLVHDRPIQVPCDDSVMRTDGDDELPIRRSRGYAPMPLRLPFSSEPTLAVGGELKNAFCLASEHQAWMSQHIGDMGSVETLSAFERSSKQFTRMYEVNAEWVVADAHPSYHTRQWAEGREGASLKLAQHHHAHVASVMAENSVPEGERVIGFAFDGTGYGTDGAIWGGEVLLASYDMFERPTHLRYVPLPGGDATIRKPFRSALAHLWAAEIEWKPDLAPVHFASPVELNVLRRQLERNVQCVPTSSMGRLFDAVSSLLDVRHVVSYEAQAAIELEWIANRHLDAPRSYRFDRDTKEFGATSLLRGVIGDLREGYPRGAIAAGFHAAVANLIADVADSVRQATGVQRVALTGGVFQNLLLVTLARASLAERGFDVLTHHLVPPNDGGLALGQVAVAHFLGHDYGGMK